jgi:Peptidase family M50
MFLASLPYFLLAMLLHEAGHYAAAYACRVTISEFGIGWGRRIFGFRFREVEYVIRLWPVGAYVRLDLNELQERPLAQQVLVLLAGIIVNLIAGSLTTGTVFSVTNYLLAATNMLPLYQQDGWKCGMVFLRGIFSRRSLLVEWTFTIAGSALSLALMAAAAIKWFH